MTALRWLFIVACLGCLVIVAVPGRWEGRLTREGHTWIIDLEHAPIWAPPEIPSYQQFREVFVNSDNFPAETSTQLSIRRVLRLDWMAIDLLLYIWPVTVVGGLLYLALRGNRRDLILHCGLSAGIGLTAAAMACVGLWLMYGGWGPPYPVFFGISGLIIGALAGLALYEP